MIDSLSNDFSFLQKSMSLQNQRMELISSNIANADTPNYKARDFDFSKELSKAIGGLPNTSLKLTSERHIPAQANGPMHFEPQYRIPFQPSMDGNTVEMDTERMAFADNTTNQQATLTFINSKIKGLMTALQPT